MVMLTLAEKRVSQRQQKTVRDQRGTTKPNQRRHKWQMHRKYTHVPEEEPTPVAHAGHAVQSEKAQVPERQEYVQAPEKEHTAAASRRLAAQSE